MDNMKILLLLCFISISTHLCSASAGEELWRITKGLHEIFQDSLDPVDIHLKIKGFHGAKLINSVVTQRKKFRDKTFSFLTNKSNVTMNKITIGSSLKTVLTHSVTVTKTKEISGEVTLPIPIENFSGKIGLKFSESRAVQNSVTEEITRNIPSDTVPVPPYSKCKVITKLFVKEITYTYALSFELDMCDFSPFFNILNFIVSTIPVPGTGLASKAVEVVSSSQCSRILFKNKHIISPEPIIVTYLGSFLQSYIKDVLKTSSYPVYIKDRETNQTVLEITGPLPGGKVYMRNVLMNVVVEEPIYESETETFAIPNPHST